MFLCMNNASKQYPVHSGVLPILLDSTVSFDQRRSYAIMGPSGSGKTTLLKMLCGVESCDSGKIFLRKGPETQRIFSAEFSFVPQDVVLFDELTIIENIMLASRTVGTGFSTAKQDGYTFLDMFDLGQCASLWPSQLSGGMKQRVCIIQALIRKPLFILADEPTAHLDVDSKRHVLRVLLEHAIQQKIGLIIATHDPHVACQLDATMHLDKGQLGFL